MNAEERKEVQELTDLILNKKAIGLTKRQYFAGLAMQGMLVNMGRNGINSIDDVAMQAKECADKLIAELEKTEAKP